MPPFVPPMLAQSVDELPTGPQWAYEPKLDGHRTQIRKDGSTIDIRTRNNKRPLVNVRLILVAAAKVKAHQAIIDGELTALDERGIPSFQVLQNRNTNYTIAFFAFDLLFLDGLMLASKPLSARQALLAKVIKGSGLYLCAPLPGDPEA